MACDLNPETITACEQAVNAAFLQHFCLGFIVGAAALYFALMVYGSWLDRKDS